MTTFVHDQALNLQLSIRHFGQAHLDGGERKRGERKRVVHFILFFNIYLFIYLLVFWVIPGDAQELLLVLHSGITPGGAQGTIWDAGN